MGQHVKPQPVMQLLIWALVFVSTASLLIHLLTSDLGNQVKNVPSM